MFLIKAFPYGIEKGRKMPNFCQEKGIGLSRTQKIYLHFFSEISCSELIFIFSLWNLYLQSSLNQKIVHKIKHLTTQKTVKVPCLSLVNQLLRVLLASYQQNCQYFHYHQFPTDLKVIQITFS